MRLLIVAIVTPLLLSAGAPGSVFAQEVSGSIPGAVVGGLAGGSAALWAFYPFTGCPMITVGAARPRDACDTGAILALAGGAATGAVLGARDRDLGYGMGLGWVAGFGTGWLLGKAGVDTPRWLDAAFLVAGVTVGGILGNEGDEGEPSPPSASVPLFTLPLAHFQ